MLYCPSGFDNSEIHIISENIEEVILLFLKKWGSTPSKLMWKVEVESLMDFQIIVIVVRR